MSTAVNHRKRSHRSEQNKRGAFSAASRKAYYNAAQDNRNRSVMSRMFNLFRRKAPAQNVSKEVAE